MAKKNIYYINEHQAAILIKEELNNPDLQKMAGDHHSAYPHPISTGKFNDPTKGVGVGLKDKEPEIDLKTLPKPVEIKEAWGLLHRAAALLVQGAPKLQDDTMKKRILKMAQEVNTLLFSVNADINVNETDLTT